MKDKMVNDAQVQSPPNLDVRGDERTNEKCDVNRSVKVLEYKVVIPPKCWNCNVICLNSEIICNFLLKGLLWTCALREICLAALWLPLGALIFCYVTASMFQADDIHETHCRVSIWPFSPRWSNAVLISTHLPT